jgi:hypothetical protein
MECLLRPRSRKRAKKFEDEDEKENLERVCKNSVRPSGAEGINAWILLVFFTAGAPVKKSFTAR